MRIVLLVMLAALTLAGCEASGPAVDVVPKIVGGIAVGVPVTVTLSGPVGNPGDFSLPYVDGLTVTGSGADPNTKPPSYNFFVTPAHAGDFTIPAFYIHSKDGQTFHVQALKLHVTSGG
ncbi:MAG TPA: hypothetical protein VGZ93_08200 [Candidatus Methylacidiphilales bacterium]|jgi:hypothetical protein|nr:hypothetical protein [Candidatus Methylacidiphilales bacterium]